jgi:hypothetical protein
MRYATSCPLLRVAALALLLLASGRPGAAAEDAPIPVPEKRLFDSGRLLATAGVSAVEGAAGGGLSPWAVIAGYGSRDGIGGTGRGTVVLLRDFRLASPGLAVGFFDRLELSYARLGFDTREAGAALGLGRGFTFGVDVYGAKLRLFGDLVADQDTWLPQVAIGAQLKHNNRGDVLRAIGARDDTGLDLYVSATKLFLAESLLVNATLRATRANQLGILGFGGDRNDSYRPQLEASVGWLVSRDVVLGAEYRMKPDNLGFARERDWADVFLAWLPSKNVSLTFAWLEAGSIATFDRQRGPYLSLQVGF